MLNRFLKKNADSWDKLIETPEISIINNEYSWESSEVVAPDIIIENWKLKIWHTGVIGNFSSASIGYAEIDYPVEW